MIEIADVFRQFAGDYLDKHGASILPSHRRAIDDILNCRTETQGGHVYRCDTCNEEIFSYHSCKNRHCPKCHTEQTDKWLEQRQAEILPVPYFHITITIPKELREIFRANQRDCYAILMKATAEAITKLALDPKFCGGIVGILALLHTWTQQLIYHPHVHCLVTGGGISKDGQLWLPSRNGFLVPVEVLSVLVRGKVMAAIKKERPDLNLPKSVWKHKWVVHSVPWGKGEKAVLEYLARYAFRIAITNSRIVALDDNTGTIRYKHLKSNRWRTCRLSGEEFMRRFLQHVLPSGFHKIRYYGLWHPSKRKELKRIRLLLELEQAALGNIKKETESQPDEKSRNAVRDGDVCPICDKGHLIYVKEIKRKSAMGP